MTPCSTAQSSHTPPPQTSAIRDLQSAAAEVERIGGNEGDLWPEMLRIQRVDDVHALLVIANEVGAAQHAHVVRHVGDYVFEECGQLADVFWPGPQALDDLETPGIRERPEQAGAVVGLQRVT